MYRIQIGEVYDGCIPITVWFVQMKKETMFGDKWIKIKGFDRREKAEDEDVKLFYSTITDNVGITCGEKNVFLSRGQFEALAYLMRRCFYTRQMLDEAHQILDKEKCPYTVYSSKDDEIWDVEIEKD